MSSVSGKSLAKLDPLVSDAAEKVKAAARKVPQPVEGGGVATAAGAAMHPGVERWPVKTGTDADVAKVGVNTLNGENLGPGLVDTTVEEMLALPRAADMPSVSSSFAKNSYYQDRRAAPTETTVWRMKATVTEAKLEQDGDYHLVLQGTSGKTMIGEIPNPDPAYVKNPVWLADIKVARNAMDAKLGGPLKAVDFAPETMAPPTKERFETASMPDESAAMTKIGKSATIIGVGFFDSSHGQTGVAPSAIELHPIFSIVFD
ncbi:MAG TPA: hypothetical protein VLV89_00965 [Candidatus Acidoferrum sp.]|nr:hypothetical protein [Candidatus Acidoferrum sp.]